MSQLWDYIRGNCLEHQVSDFILQPGRPLLYIKHGITLLAKDVTVAAEDFAKIAKVLPPKQELRDVDAAYQHEDIRFRVSYFTSRRAPKMVMRLLPKTIPSLENIRIPEKLIKQVTSLTKGIVLVCGPTGCGKSTTIAALLREIMRLHEWHLLTLEDPIEYPLSDNPDFGHRVTAREIGTDILDFSSALRSGLRQAPKVILVGEIRDRETAEMAMNASLTGHLVLSTLHTNTAPLTIARLLQLFPPEMTPMIAGMLPDVLACIVCQRLEPSMDGGKRVALHEIMQMTPSICNHIRNRSYSDIEQEIETGRKMNHQSFKLAYDQAIESRLINRKHTL